MSDAGRVLVVDDDPPVREVLTDYFASRGYAVLTAANGREALDVFGHDRPDVVLLDMRMPEMDGIEVLKRVRASHPTVPVIMVTANDDVTLARETLAIGAFDYVAKPFDFEYLTQTIMTALLHSARTLPVEAEAPALGLSDPWSRFLTDVFRAVRGMALDGRAATGARLENAALAASREAIGGRCAEAAPHLIEVELLVKVAAELGDLSAAGRLAIDAALTAARAELTR